MRKNEYIAIAGLIVMLLLVFVYYSVITQYHFYISEISPDGTKIAKFAWRRTFPFALAVEGWLVVEDTEKNTKLIEKRLLGGRDSPEEITHEFIGLSWEGDSILLKLEPLRYGGPIKFKVK